MWRYISLIRLIWRESVLLRSNEGLFDVKAGDEFYALYNMKYSFI